jgi:hypothetical protein
VKTITEIFVCIYSRALNVLFVRMAFSAKTALGSERIQAQNIIHELSCRRQSLWYARVSLVSFTFRKRDHQELAICHPWDGILFSPPFLVGLLLGVNWRPCLVKSGFAMLAVSCIKPKALKSYDAG